ncbi:MAG: hypothetical protein LBV72_07260 [Tannerella sp.]|jgi:hypothetical protein|nr:hypothetical protein [Tannerella sp.]
MNLYIFNEIRLGAVYGIGTYIRELSSALKNSDIHVCIVNLASEKPQIQIEEIDGIKQWNFPSPVQWISSSEEQWDLYHHNVVYLLQLRIKDKKNLIFHLNYNQKSRLAEELKKAFDCKIMLTIHYFDWCFNLSGNLTRFRDILETQQTDKDIEELKEVFQKEKKLCK